MENNQLTIDTTANQQKISKAIGGFSAEEVAVVKSTVAKNTTDTELAFFLMTCKSAGLNPFLKEIWCYKDHRGNLIIFAGRDGFLKKAQNHPKYAGMRSGVIRAGDDWELDIPTAVIHHKINKPLDERGKILGAYCFVFRKEEEPTLAWCPFDLYNKGQSAWKTHPEDMILKVAESKALKKAFGMSELQIPEEWEVRRDGTVRTLENNLLPDIEANQK